MLAPYRADTRSMTTCSTPTMSVAPAGPRASRSLWERSVKWLVAARSHRVLCLVAGIWLINAFDLTFTILSHEQGMLVEMNPVAQHMLDCGVPSLLLYKIGLVFIGSYPLLKFRSMRITEWGSIVVLLAYATLAVRWSDCYDAYAAAFHGVPHYVDAAVSSPPSVTQQ